MAPAGGGPATTCGSVPVRSRCRIRRAAHPATARGTSFGRDRPAARRSRCSGGEWGAFARRPRSGARGARGGRSGGARGHSTRSRSPERMPKPRVPRRWGRSGRLGVPMRAGRRAVRWCGHVRWGRSRWRCRRVPGAAPAGALLDAVVSSAEGEQVGCGGGPERPGPYVVEVAEPGGDATAGEPAAAVAGADQRGEVGARPVGVGGEVVTGVEACPGERVAGDEPRLCRPHTAPACRGLLGYVVLQPPAAHEQRLGRPAPLYLDQVVVRCSRSGMHGRGVLSPGCHGARAISPLDWFRTRLGVSDHVVLGPGGRGTQVVGALG